MTNLKNEKTNSLHIGIEQALSQPVYLYNISGVSKDWCKYDWTYSE